MIASLDALVGRRHTGGPTDFEIAFDPRDEEELLNAWRLILQSNRWTEGDAVVAFEAEWSAWHGEPSVAVSSWTGGALGVLDYIGVRGHTVLCPSNTFIATPRSVLAAGGEVAFYDCNREDLCGSFEDFVRKAEQHKPKAAWLVHIGGHIAFDVERIAKYCLDTGILLIEDCAHAHGATWNGQRAGQWGVAGVYSFYATKTISTAEGGMVVSADPGLIDHLRAFRNYGKGATRRVEGMNFRMTEFAAAMGAIQVRRMPDVIEWKRRYAEAQLSKRYKSHLILPEGMQSGYYKYIVREPVETSTGRVYEIPCHRQLGVDIDLPNSDWVSQNHWCVPIYYPRDPAARTSAILG